MKPLLFELSAAEGLASSLCHDFGLERGELSRRQFPDGETYLRLLTDVAGRDVVLFCTLDRPDGKVVPLLYAAAAASDGGARSVGLVAPYLAYMRQDKAFHPGEAVTSATFAGLLSDAFDWLVTVDPHLHRYPSLDAIYSIPSIVVSAAEPIAEWIGRHVERPLLIGPDEESAQWVERIAALAGASSTVLRKTRRGDRDVSIAPEGMTLPADATPLIVDDIASSARTLIEAVGLLPAGHRPAICVVVHAIFAGDAFDALKAAGPTIVSTNSVAHETNRIDLTARLGPAIEGAIARARETPPSFRKER